MSEAPNQYQLVWLITRISRTGVNYYLVQAIYRDGEFVPIQEPDATIPGNYVGWQASVS
jgi:hypothetical protein